MPLPATNGSDVAGRLRANEQVAQRQRGKTRRDTDLAQAFVERFIASAEIADYPVDDADVHDENRERGPQPDLNVAFEIEVGRAFARNAAPVTAVTPSFFAFQLLSMTDPSAGTTLGQLPRPYTTPDRLLAHVLRMPVKLDKRVAGSIARRLCLLLLNRAQYIGPRTLASEPLPEVPAPLVPVAPWPAGSPPPRVSEEFCVDCETAYVGTHRCGAGAGQPPGPVLGPSAPNPSSGQPNLGQARGHAERPAEPGPASKAADRRVIGHVKTRGALEWFLSAPGQVGTYATMKPGTCLEVLEPDARDRTDQEWQLRHDKRQLIVIWWRGKRRLVGNDTVDRIDKSEFEKYERDALCKP